MADVHQFRVAQGIAGCQDIRQGLRRVQAGETGDAQLHAAPVQADEIPDIGLLCAAGEDDVVDLPRFQQLHHPAVPAQLAHHLHLGPQAGDLGGGALGGVEAEAQLQKPPGHIHDLRLVPLVDGDEHPAVAVLFHMVSGGDQALEKGLPQVLPHPQHLPGGLHFRAECGVGVGDLFKGEDRHLHRHVGRAAVQPRAVTQVFEALPHHDPGGQVHHGHPRHLGDIGHGAGGAGVQLDDVQLPVVDKVLDVNQALCAQGQGQLFRGFHNGFQQPVPDGEGGIDGDGIPAVDTGAFDMLHDAGDEHAFPVGDHVHLQLLAHEVLVHQHRIIDLPPEDDLHIDAHILLRVGDDHVLPADDVTGPQEHGVAQLLRRSEGFLQSEDSLALGPPDGEAFQEGVELLPVLRQVDARCAGAQNGHARAVQEFCQADGGLAAEGHHHPHGFLRRDDVHHVLRGEGLEIEPFGGVVVRGNGLRIVIDDDRLVAQFLQGMDAADGGIVEFDALADADGAGAQHQDHRLAGAREGAGFAEGIKGGIEVGGLRVELSGAGIHHAVDGLLRRTGQGLRTAEAQQGFVGVPQALPLLIGFRREVPGETHFKYRQVLELVDEEGVDAGDGVDLLHADARLQGFEDGEQPMIVHPLQALPERRVVVRGFVQAVHADLGPPQGLHEGHFKAGGDGHDLPRGLHLGPQGAACVGKFVEGPLGEFHHHVIQSGLEAGASLAGDVIFDLVQGVAQSDLRCDLGDGIARGLAGQGGGTGDAGVDLDHRVFEALRVQGKLHVAASHDAQVGNDLQGGGAEHLVFPVRQGEGGGYHHAVPGMDPHGVHVFHRADGDHVAGRIPHGFEFDLLPPGDRALHQDLPDGGSFQPGVGDEAHLLGVVGRAAAPAPQGEGRADDHRIADALRCFQGCFLALHGLGLHHGLVDLLHGFLEELPVLCPADGCGVGAQETDAVFLQDARSIQFHGQGQARLAPQPRQKAVGPLLGNDALQGLHLQGFQVDGVGHALVRHDGGGVCVAEHHLHPALLQHPAGLGPGVIEFRRLADDDGAGADDQHLADGLISWHGQQPPSMSEMKRSKRKPVSLGPAQASGWNCTVKARKEG